MVYNPQIVDVQDYKDGGANRRRFLDDFLRALDHPGFMLLVNTGFETGEKYERFQEQRRFMKVFFSLPKEEKDKRKVADVNGEVGYTGFREDRNRDLAEHLQFCPGVTPYAENVFPAISVYKEVTFAIMDDLHGFSDLLFRAVAEAFGKDPAYFENLCKGFIRNDVLRQAYYRGLDRNEVEEWKSSYRASEHDDSCFQTFIKLDKRLRRLQCDVSVEAGLGKGVTERRYEEISVDQPGILYNTGHQCRWLTDGVKKPAFHRVVIPTDYEEAAVERITTPYFSALPKGLGIIQEPLCWHPDPAKRGKVFQPGDPYDVQQRHIAGWRPHA